jgi:hypothetical protein
MQAPLIMPCSTLSRARCSSAADSEDVVRARGFVSSLPAAELVCCTTVSCTWALLVVLLTLLLLLLALSAMLLSQRGCCSARQIIQS